MTGRNVILASILVFALAMMSGLISMLQPLESDGKGADSYGVYPSGYRGLVEVMQSLDLPANRTHAPFDPQMESQATYVLVGPDVGLLDSEEGSIDEMEKWVAAGGRLVVSFSEAWPSHKFLERFELEDILLIDLETGQPFYDLSDFDPEDEEMPLSYRKFARDREKFEEELQERSYQDDFSDIIDFKPPSCRLYELAECTGSLQSACDSVQSLALREGEIVGIDPGESSPESVLKVLEGEEMRTLIARYSYGKGSVILASDVSLFDNLSVREGDNSVFLINMLSEGRESIFFDEFYHGLSIRGNPIWIFAQPGYRIIVGMMFVAVALFIWREFVAFGTQHPPTTQSRRTLETYLDAVSQLVLRTRSQDELLLIESEDAFLWMMARKLQLPGERQQLDAIRSRLKRMNSEKLEEFENIIAEFKKYRQSGCSNKELLTLLNRSYRCLS